MDFFVRDMHYLIPVEGKSVDGTTLSLKKLIEKDSFSDIRYGIKFAEKNIGFNGKYYTFPWFLSFLLKKFLQMHQS